MANATQIKAFEDQMGPYAIQAGNATGLDPGVILAQWAEESGWGTAAPGDNYAGITDPTTGGFADYSSRQAFEQAYVSVVEQPNMSVITSTASKTASPLAQALAVGQSPWDAGHYLDSGVQGGKLIDVYNEMFGSDQASDPIYSWPGGGKYPPFDPGYDPNAWNTAQMVAAGQLTPGSTGRSGGGGGSGGPPTNDPVSQALVRLNDMLNPKPPSNNSSTPIVGGVSDAISQGTYIFQIIAVRAAFAIMFTLPALWLALSSRQMGQALGAGGAGAVGIMGAIPSPPVLVKNALRERRPAGAPPVRSKPRTAPASSPAFEPAEPPVEVPTISLGPPVSSPTISTGGKPADFRVKRGKRPPRTPSLVRI